MGLVWSVLGALAGAFLDGVLGSPMTGLLFGAALGFLFGRIKTLSERADRLESKLTDLWMDRAVRESVKPNGVPPVMDLRPTPPVEQTQPKSFETPIIDVSQTNTPVAPPLPPIPPLPSSSTSQADASRPIRVPAQAYTPSRTDPPRNESGGAFEAIKRWFTEGNVPVKVGMLVSFVGVAALLKYAADEGWFTAPIEVRLAGVGLVAIAGLIFGWRQREERRSFALSLQGGAIGVLLLTVFTAFRYSNLLPASIAFAIMVVLVAGVCVLAVLQDALALAVLGILAGFAAPILVSTGSGNHVALFSYYAVLNLAIFVIAWLRPWRALNLLGFFFTYAIGTAWGVLRYQPEQFASTEPFLVLYFVLYLAIPILYAFKRGVEHRNAIDATLIFGNPLIAFALQAGLLEGERMPLALTALGLGLLYAALARLLIHRARVLGESFAVLALGFSTLAIPLALSARATSCIFALEGAALIWLGLRQERRFPRWMGTLLQLAAAVAFAISCFTADDHHIPFANGLFIGALLIALAGFISAWLYLRAEAGASRTLPFYLWGLAWWFGAWLFEINESLPYDTQSAALLGLIALSAWLSAEAQRIWQRSALTWTTIILLWCSLAVVCILASGTTWRDGWTSLAYGVYVVLVWRSLSCLRGESRATLATAHLAWMWTWTCGLAISLQRLAIDAGLGGGWVFLLTALPLILIHGLSLYRPSTVSAPLWREFATYRPLVVTLQAAVLGLMFVFGLVHDGASHPLPYLPLLNPLELTQLAIFIGFLLWSRHNLAPQDIRGIRSIVIAIAGFAFVTAATLRATHHWAGIPWDESVITASASQTSLAVVWSLLGVAGWVIGSRRGNRTLWLAGAVLMGVVLLKLLLIDRQHLGNLFGIASFIAYGLLCTLIGYLAPAPPRQSEAEGAR
jgi:uncharacterized membrane protein